MQSTIVGFSKAKALKTQNSLNSPLAEEEEEHHKEKETGSDVLYFENHIPFSTSQPITDLVWPIKKLNYYSHTSDILIPPPKI